MKNNFLEKWILNLVKSEYEVGNIPKNAIYKFKDQKGNCIEVTVEWVNPENVDCKIVYVARAFGKVNHISENDSIHNPIFKVDSYYTLEVHTYMNDIKRSYSTRKIVDYDVENVIEQVAGLEEVKR
nr:hypothetical protein [uncultured Allomuricauda sp.]